MERIKDELIKDFLTESGFQMDNFDISEVPFLTGYILTDKNKESMMIVKPLFTERSIDVTVGRNTYSYVKGFSNIDKQYHWYNV